MISTSPLIKINKMDLIKRENVNAEIFSLKASSLTGSMESLIYAVCCKSNI